MGGLCSVPVSTGSQEHYRNKPSSEASLGIATPKANKGVKKELFYLLCPLTQLFPLLIKIYIPQALLCHAFPPSSVTSNISNLHPANSNTNIYCLIVLLLSYIPSSVCVFVIAMGRGMSVQVVLRPHSIKPEVLYTAMSPACSHQITACPYSN